MGIDVDGGMIVGERASKLNISESMLGEYNCEDLSEFYSEVLDNMSPYFDSDVGDWIVGYTVPDVLINSPEFDQWWLRVREMAHNFEKLTGVPARLIGTQNVT